MQIKTLTDLYNLWSQKIVVFRYKNLIFPIEKLKKHIEEDLIPNFLPVWQTSYNWETGEVQRLKIEDSGNNYFGGWSIQSDRPHYYTGWEPTGSFNQGKIKFDKNLFGYVVPTELYYGAFSETIELLKNEDFEPFRARITIVKPGHELKWHVDYNDGNMVIRFQIPIITNPSVFFHSETEKWHFPASGHGYILNANHLHKVTNNISNRFIFLINIKLKEHHIRHFEIFPPYES